MLISLQNISFSFGARPMLEDASWQIGTGERIGLVGVNGAGKSTLLRLITGAYKVDSGVINKPKDVTIGFFNQDLLSFSTDNSILSVGMGAFERAQEIEIDMNRILHELESKPDDADLLDEYSHALHDFEVAGGYEMEHKAAEVLEGLGFSTADLQRPYNQFSGGWRMRVLLAKMMLQAPDLLLLDEPTNHLDLPSIEWLERYLQGYPGSVVIVSHDRYFLDRMVTKIVEVWQRDLVPYSGNYSFFEKEKVERMELQQRAYENQQDYIRQQERFIERFRAQATKAAQAQSALKRLDKLDRIEAPDGSVPVMNINFDVAVQPGKIICTLKDVSKSFGDLQILNHANAEIIRGDKIALIGANGKGKSTLLRIIADRETFDGERKGGHNVEESFYAQHQLEALNVENEILDELKSAGTGKTELELRQLLGCFLFSGDNVFKKIKVLSGGEKARVALAKVIAAKGNFLMLDEPTNHLDMHSVEMLIDALNKYQGTLIFVSHDRYFVSKTVNKIWEIIDGEIKEFIGSYDEWVVYKKERAEREALEAKNAAPKPVEKKVEVKKTVSLSENEQRNLRKEHQNKTKALERLEGDLKKLNEEKTLIEGKLGDPAVYSNKDEFKKLDDQYKQLTAKLETINTQYDKTFEEAMELEEKLG
ncbi:ABC-F family ATP-binding cassette domain-containing protein [Taibaiella soli]|uniref:ABC transporter ATP-binding protein n=1 Tax=Taibaiella soli TaxID=1649169 RepID=A0A2W2B3F2_9BACT|nr:ABC-F family ATP-binding cassette domain-containing protein [Taibaiella soli]PZF70747.1 ABC transporter ATP-binding protein [Taibaiella soli]